MKTADRELTEQMIKIFIFDLYYDDAADTRAMGKEEMEPINRPFIKPDLLTLKTDLTTSFFLFSSIDMRIYISHQNINFTIAILKCELI